MNISKPPSILVILFAATFLKDLVWSTALPVFHGPDEQAHFAQIQYYVEKGNLDLPSENNLSQEVLLSEELLGTKRDGRGNNKFTYHPEFNIEYTSSLTGIHEEKISALPASARKNLVAAEAAGYPPLYYLFAAPAYSAAYPGDLFDRVFAVRLVSILLHIALVWVAFRTGKIIWENNLLAISLSALVSFHPMINFLSASIHPDNLLNLLYALAIFTTLLILKFGLRKKYLVYLATIFLLGYQTKILILFFAPSAAAVIVAKIFPIRLALPLSAAALAAPIFALFGQFAIVPLVPQVTSQSPLANLSLLEYLRFRLPKLLFEVWPWYWGVFKWLGVTLPIEILRVITRVAVLLTVGLGVKIIQIIKDRDLSFQTKVLGFFLLSSASYVVYLVFWDYRLMQSIGWSQGLQGRYLFPNIIPHMAIFLFGAVAIGSLIKKSHLAAKLLVTLMIALNFAAFWRLVGSYYDLGNFLVQVSQYKPEIFKGVNFVILTVLTIIAQAIFVLHFWRQR